MLLFVSLDEQSYGLLWHGFSGDRMRILVLSLMDSGGGCGKLARAIHEHPDHQAKAARWRKGRTSTASGSLTRPER
jgi:hypothetical protein